MSFLSRIFGRRDPAPVTPATPAPLLVTPDALQRLGWVDPHDWAPILSAAAEREQITTPQRLAMWLANCGHETMGGRRLVESFDYDAARLGQVFGARAKEALPYARRDGKPAQQEAIANAVYGGEWGAKNLGNTVVGDGWRWRGRGLIQITGRRNYGNVAVLIGRKPDAMASAMEQRQGAADTAALWWRLAGCNALADAGAVETCRAVVNGGRNGLDEVRERYRLALAVLRGV